jgi:hypothetical protein
MISTHPTDARYFASRSHAYDQKRSSEKVVRLGSFAGGSFGCYPPILGNGRYAGQKVGPGGYGPIPSVTVWMTTAK